jgi:hypothetical protein
MTAAVAHLAHATRGRARLRLPASKGDARAFRRIEDELRKCPSVIDVATNAATASVLVRYRGDFDAVSRHAEAQALFEIQASDPARADEGGSFAGPSSRTLDELRRALGTADERLRQRTSGRVDLGTVAFGALLGGSIYQLARGEFLPVGGTMLMQAIGVLFGRPRSGE